MSKKVTLEGLPEAINNELKLYTKSVAEGVKKSARKNMREMVKETKAQRFKQDTGAYRKAITSKAIDETPSSLSMLWYVKEPHYRLTHLLEHGHAKKGGGRTIAYGFVGKAEDKAVKTFEREVEEAIKNG